MKSMCIIGPAIYSHEVTNAVSFFGFETNIQNVIGMYSKLVDLFLNYRIVAGKFALLATRNSKDFVKILVSGVFDMN